MRLALQVMSLAVIGGLGIGSDMEYAGVVGTVAGQ